MTYITIAERKGIEKGIQKGKIEGLQRAILVVLEVKFGEAGLKFNEKVKKVDDLSELEKILKSIIKISDLKNIEKLFD